MKPTFLALFLLARFTVLPGQPVITVIRQNSDTVGLYDKFETGLALKAEYANPFDPDQIDVSADFTSPSGKHWPINGFYSAAAGATWKIRFSPDERGVWRYSIRVRDRNGEATSEKRSFMAVASGYHGALIVAPNRRYLQYRDGTEFYGVGLWYNDSYTGFDAGRVKPEELDKLKGLGMNFISSFITPLETQATGPGRYDQNICGRLDQLLELCEQKNIELSLNIWFHAYLSETVWGAGNIRWETNPYQQVTTAKDFYGNAAAWALQEKLYRYMIARWGYSRALGIWFIIDEINGTDGWVKGDTAVASQWAAKVHGYFSTGDPYHRPTTGTRSGGVREYWKEGYQTFDLAAREIYERQGWPVNNSSTVDSAATSPLASSYMNYAGEVGRLWKEFSKPILIGETGWDHVFYEPSMPGYLAQYHNTLWVCLASGTAMTPFWWAYSDLLNDNLLTHQVSSFRRFTDSIPFARLSGTAPAQVRVSKGNAYAIKSDQLIFGWVVNPATDVAGARVQLRSIPKGRYKLMIYHTWRGRFIGEEDIRCYDGTLEFGIPRLIGGEHANYIGQDAAFVLIPLAREQ
ncbi:MAG TPA: DUF5060 domain-containing protein [Puia sp.]|nr:DUF5060 domain-containing protein [Puia sp.]